MIRCLPFLLLCAMACRTRPPTTPAAAAGPAASGPLDGPELEWWRKSMETREQRLGWWREARFGMFIHWGVYSQLGGEWQGRRGGGYAEHIQRQRKIPIAVYRREVAATFNPTGFDAEQWVRVARDAGMGYLIITAKHHDGFAMYDSRVSDYDVMDATAWKHDPMRDLEAACRRQGVRFGFYYSHAFDWGDAEAPGNDWDYQNPGGDLLLHGGRNWFESEPALIPQVRRYVDRKAIPQLRELIAGYNPDILWFDTPHKLPPAENLRILRAVREARPSVVINGRGVQTIPGGPPARFGDYASTADGPAEFAPHPGDWEGIPTTNKSYGWHRFDLSHKPAEHFIVLLAKAAARGGNVLLNVGPRGDGRIDEPDLKILAGIGAWMKVNGESIRGTTRTPLAVQAWGESTRKGNVLYLHVLQWPRGGRLVVGGLRATPRRATVLANPGTALEWERGADDVMIQLPAAAPDKVDTVIALELSSEMAVDPARVIGRAVPADVLRAFDGQRDGDLAFGSGKATDAYVQGWSRLDQAMRWPVRLREASRYDVSITYDAEARSAGGAFLVTLDDQKLTGEVVASKGQALPLGRVTLSPGRFDIVVAATKIEGGELMRLRSLTLTPVD